MIQFTTLALFLFNIIIASSISNHLYDSSTLLKPSCPTSDSISKNLIGIYKEDNKNSKVVLSNYFSALQFDGSGNYYLYKNFYCPKGVPCPQTFAPILPTMGHFSIANIKCDGFGLTVSFDLNLTETVNSLNIKVDPTNQSTYTYRVNSSNGILFNSLTFSDSTESKSILKLNDICVANKLNDQCQTITQAEGTKCYVNKCKFVESINT